MSIKMMSPDIYRIELPAPLRNLKPVNTYFIRSEDRSLLIDTGYNFPQSEEAMLSALDELGADMNKTDIFLTHMHADHCGLTSRLAKPGTTVYASREDGQIIANGTGDPLWESYRELFSGSGLGKRDEVSGHVGYYYTSPAIDSIVYVPDGHCLRVGKYSFSCILTKGHTSGHMCLYEPKKRILFCGDHILCKPNPVIMLMDIDGDEDILAEYFDALDTVERLDASITYPGHNDIIRDHKGLIRQTREHHAGRLHDVLAAVGPEPKSAIEIAKSMTWGFFEQGWDHYDGELKFLMLTELLAHLRHLQAQGLISVTKPQDSYGALFELKTPLAKANFTVNIISSQWNNRNKAL